jgi:hypothetical protein
MSGVQRAFVGELVELVWTLVDLDGVTTVWDAVDADFAKVLLIGSVASAQPMTVTETDEPGVYATEFTPDAPGRWLARVTHIETGLIYECVVDVGARAFAQCVLAVESGTTVYVEAWLERDGQGIVNPTSASVDVRDRDGVLVSSMSSLSADARGHFTMSAAIVMTANRPYNVIVTINDARGAVKSYHGFATVSP